MSNDLKPRSSYHGGETPKESIHSENPCKSDVNFISWLKPEAVSESESSSVLSHVNKYSGEYYKKYEHDEIPVRDNSYKGSKGSLTKLRSRDSGNSLTNSDLERLENKIYKNISQELHTDNSTVGSLETNIQFLRTTVEEIFDKFYANMRDFEIYKKRYDEILERSRDDCIVDMENFIRDIFQHIFDSTIDNNTPCEIETLEEEIKNTSVEKAMGDASAHQNTTVVAERNKEKLLESSNSVITYKNDNHCTDATLVHNISKINGNTKKEKAVNIYLLGDAPCVQIKMYDRNLLSEINIKNTQRERNEFHVISADNITKIIDKKFEMEKHAREIYDDEAIDREIPVKESFAKKNISLNEDFTQEKEQEENKSLLSKICSYICKKLRKY